nr:hypothetical protein [Tanacetum cinerariifolium]
IVRGAGTGKFELPSGLGISALLCGGRALAAGNYWYSAGLKKLDQ